MVTALSRATWGLFGALFCAAPVLATTTVRSVGGQPVAQAGSGSDTPRPWMGVALEQRSVLQQRLKHPPPEDATQEAPRGVALGGIVKDSPADRAELRAGDIVVSLDGHPVDSPDQFIRYVGAREIGDWVQVSIDRRGEWRDLSVRLGSRTGDADRLSWKLPWLGVEFVDVPQQLREYWGGSADEGVLVGSVDEGGPAEQAGLRPGDMLLVLDGHVVGSGDEVNFWLRFAGVGNRIELAISRQGNVFPLKVHVEEPPPEDDRADEAASQRDMRRVPPPGRARDTQLTLPPQPRR